MVDDVVAVDRGVDRRLALQRFNRSLDEEGHEAQAHAVVLLLEHVLVLGAQVHDRLHVDFVVGGQHGHGGLSLDQTLGHLGAQTGHRHALLDAVTGGEQRSVGGRSSGLGSRSGRLAGRGSDGVFLGHATTLAGAVDAVAVEAGFVGDLARGRGQDLVLGGGRSGSSGGRRRGSGSSGRSSSGSACVQGAQQLAGENGFALALDDFTDHAIGFGQHFHDDLVGLDVDDQFVALDGFARLLVPGGNGAVGNRFREGGGFDLNSHVMNSCLSDTSFGD